MQEEIKAGSVLIREGTVFPETLRLETTSYSPGWRSVDDLDGYAMDKKTQVAGWTFFYLAGENRATVFGKEVPETVHRAVKQILAGLKSEKFNSVEITRLVFENFLGVSYATVSFHMRNLQEGMVLLDKDNLHPWKDTRLVAA